MQSAIARPKAAPSALARILAAQNPLNAVRQTAGPWLRDLEQQRPGLVPALLAGLVESAPMFEPTVGGVFGKAGESLVGPELLAAMKQLDKDPTQYVDLVPGMMSSPVAYPMVGSLNVKKFDAWRASIWDDVKRGKFHPEEFAPSNSDLISGRKAASRLFRAVSDNELSAAEKSGAFRPLRAGDPDLYVTADPDRLAGGAYGAKGGGAIVEFDPVPVHKATGRLMDLDEVAASEIPFDKVRRIWRWDADAGDHVLDYVRPGE